MARVQLSFNLGQSPRSFCKRVLLESGSPCSFMLMINAMRTATPILGRLGQAGPEAGRRDNQAPRRRLQGRRPIMQLLRLWPKEVSVCVTVCMSVRYEHKLL
jgi:hypothetical protein